MKFHNILIFLLSAIGLGIVIFNIIIQSTLYLIENNLYIIYLVFSLIGAFIYSSAIIIEKKKLIQ